MKVQYNKKELEVMLKSQNVDVVIDALMYLCFNVADREWVLQKCIDAVNEGLNNDIKGLGVTCIGHVARIYKDIDRSKIIPFLESKLQDASLVGRVQDALQDIEKFIE